MPDNAKIRELAEHPWLLLLSRIIAPLATAGVVAMFGLMWSLNGRLIALETRSTTTQEAVIALGDAVLRNTERITTREASAFTASDGAALEARMNARIDRQYERLADLIEQLRDDIRRQEERPEQ